MLDFSRCVVIQYKTRRLEKFQEDRKRKGKYIKINDVKTYSNKTTKKKPKKDSERLISLRKSKFEKLKISVF